MKRKFEERKKREISKLPARCAKSSRKAGVAKLVQARTRQRSEDRKARFRYTTAKTPLPCQDGPNVHSVPGISLPGRGVLRLQGGGSWDPRHLPTLYADPALYIFERAQSQYSRAPIPDQDPQQSLGCRNFNTCHGFWFEF